MVGSTQTSLGRTLNDSLETTIEPRSTKGLLKGFFCSDVVFNLSNKILYGTEINVLGKGLGFTPTPSFINESDFKRDFEDFARKMRCKWYFRNDITENFSQLPAFRNKSNWNPPKGHPALEMFLSQYEKDIFSVLLGNTSTYNLTKNESLAMSGLAEDRSIIIKPADKGSCIVVWDRADYLAEA